MVVPKWCYQFAFIGVRSHYEILTTVSVNLVYLLLGELLKYFLPLPIPASIYGMVILFIGLLSGIIKLDAVKDVGKFLIEIMPVMFIPAGVGLMASWGTLKPVLVPVSVITVVALVAVMGATGRVSQCVIKKSKAKEKAKEQEI